MPMYAQLHHWPSSIGEPVTGQHARHGRATMAGIGKPRQELSGAAQALGTVAAAGVGLTYSATVISSASSSR
jgi:hypothetical protein